MGAHAGTPVGGSTGVRDRQGLTGQTRRGTHSVTEARLRVLFAIVDTLVLPPWHTRGRTPLHLPEATSPGGCR